MTLNTDTSSVQGIRTEFSGCLRDIKLNEKKFDADSRKIGTVPCAQFTERGMFFGADGGYAIVNKDFKVRLYLITYKLKRRSDFNSSC